MEMDAFVKCLVHTLAGDLVLPALVLEKVLYLGI